MKHRKGKPGGIEDLRAELRAKNAKPLGSRFGLPSSSIDVPVAATSAPESLWLTCRCGLKAPNTRALELGPAGKREWVVLCENCYETEVTRG